MRDISRNVLIPIATASALLAAACASYAPAPLAQDYALSGTRWVAQSINGQVIAAAHAPQIAFGQEFRLSGSGGCNRLSAVYEAEDNRLDVRGLGVTRMACDAPVMAVENQFVSVIEDADRYQRDGQRLVIAAEDGRSIAFVAASG